MDGWMDRGKLQKLNITDRKKKKKQALFCTGFIKNNTGLVLDQFHKNRTGFGPLKNKKIRLVVGPFLLKTRPVLEQLRKKRIMKEKEKGIS